MKISDCDLTSHALLSVDSFINDDYGKINTVNTGETIISDRKDMYFLINQVQKKEWELQSIFDSEGISYLSLFISYENLSEDLKAFLDGYGLLHLLQGGESTGVNIGFPERFF